MPLPSKEPTRTSPSESRRRTPALLLSVLLAGLVLAAVPSCSRRVDSAVALRFQAAEKAFAAARTPEDFRRVALQYQEILDAGITSGIVLYNQGNAWINAGEPGRAVAAYRQALRYLPRDPQLQANLALASGEATGAAQRRPLIETILFWQNWLSYPATFQLAAVMVLATLGLATAALFLRSHRQLLVRLTLAVLPLAALAVFSAGYDWYRFDYVKHGVVVQEKVIARKGNAESYQPAFEQPLGEGTSFELLDRRGDWLRIELPGDQRAWIRSDQAVTY